MISRLTTIALTVAVLATATLAFAASAGQDAAPASPAADKPAQVLQLERVVIVGKRLPREAGQ